MAFTSKISSVLKGAIKNQVANSIGSLANNLISGQNQTNKIAAKLLNKSPLEIDNVSPMAHMKENPYQYGTVYYPNETANLGEGHYVIFDVIMHNASKFKSTSFNNGRISTNKDTLVGEVNSSSKTNNSVAAIKAGIGASERVQGVKSGLNEKTPTHTYISDSIILYMPAAALKFNYGATYDTPSTGIAGLIGQGIGDFRDTKGFVEKLKSMGSVGGDAVKQIGRKALFGAASLIPGFEGAEAAYDKALGQAVNPQNEVVFQSVPFREFDFPFEFAPKNAKEKDNIHKIINMFKFHMMPEYQGTTKGYFNVPSEFQITYMYREERNTYIPRVSRCVLKNMNVDYAPEGVISSFIPDEQGAAPTLATMSLSFTETEIMTKERIADGY
jgi:hypothetical protein|tara:strand:+ start:2005 stop:3162 length:1158 start_codon:yes stop_codon:yes gene_type:complete